MYMYYLPLENDKVLHSNKRFVPSLEAYRSREEDFIFRHFLFSTLLLSPLGTGRGPSFLNHPRMLHAMLG